MITVLALYNNIKQTPPTKETLQKIDSEFKTDSWEFNCYSRDVSLVTEHPSIDYPCHLYANWEPKSHHKKIAKAIQKHFIGYVDNNFYNKIGLSIEPNDNHVNEFATFCKHYNLLVDTIGQVAAMPSGVENHSPMVYNNGWDINLQHDPWRYFKILKNNEIERKQLGFKTTGGSGLREPINSSNILFCRSKDTIDQHCIAHYHALYTLTRPIVAENCFRFQVQPSFTTLGGFKWNNLIELVIEHLGIQVVTYNEFEAFEEQYWNEHDVTVNKVEYK